MSDDIRDKMLVRIDALLKKAAASEFEEERDSFEKAATRLMVKWEIAERDLGIDNNPIVRHERDYSAYGNFVYGMGGLAIKLAKMHGGYGFYAESKRERGKRKGSHVTFYGVQRVADVIDELIPFFFRQMEYECLVVYKEKSRQSFSKGWCDKVGLRLIDQMETLYSESMALVPTNTEAQQEAKKYHRIGSNVKVGLNTAYYDGQVSGSVADLGNARIN